MARVTLWISVGAAVVLLACWTWLGRRDAAGPLHVDVRLEGDVPATLHLPVSVYGTGPGRITEPAPRGERTPGVVLVHGFAGDRQGLSVLARSLAHAGYAVLTLDVRGHGQNRHPFSRDRLRGSEQLGREVAAGVEFLRSSPFVDGTRVAIGGHSMGAGASLDHATRDPGLDGTILISGGGTLRGPHRPANTLFIYASADPEGIKERSAELASRLAGAELAAGEVHGDFDRHTAVQHVEVPGADHATIIVNGLAAQAIVQWLDGIYGAPRDEPAGLRDGRLAPLGLGFAAFLLMLPGVGFSVGRLAPRRPERSAAGAAGRLGLLVLALAATLPLFSVGRPGALLPLEVGDVVIVHLGLAGAGVFAALALRGRARASLEGVAGSLPAALVGFVAIYFTMSPLGAVFHELAPTPERAVAGVASALWLAPFTLAFHDLLRRGSTLVATLTALGGRVVVVLVLVAGVMTGISSGVVMLMLPTLAVLFLVIEIACVAVYAVGRNAAACAWLEAVWLAWVFAAVLPIRI